MSIGLLLHLALYFHGALVLPSCPNNCPTVPYTVPFLVPPKEGSTYQTLECKKAMLIVYEMSTSHNYMQYSTIFKQYQSL
ncbi:hypothetical protein XELAEV_18046193mg [Xenopus laevis]|uniref:Secreted protein n=1 Tax=Xenopus laevis TaxID=8355 RepID=A0A974BSV9_XENLA|nr:hypothetical protein XELAEV_18046193mg [Xenopus laevis]